MVFNPTILIKAKANLNKSKQTLNFCTYSQLEFICFCTTFIHLVVYNIYSIKFIQWYLIFSKFGTFLCKVQIALIKILTILRKVQSFYILFFFVQIDFYLIVYNIYSIRYNIVILSILQTWHISLQSPTTLRQSKPAIFLFLFLQSKCYLVVSHPRRKNRFFEMFWK